MKNEIMEIREAIVAGERALDSLYAAKDQLKGARGWGFIDLFGGGFLTDVIKHSKMNQASKCMENAKYHLQIFQRELNDVNLSLNLRMEIGGFLSFADFFFDGFVADYLVQSKITSARNQVEDAIVNVTNVLEALRREQ